jgi:hypothetical protein
MEVVEILEKHGTKRYQGTRFRNNRSGKTREMEILETWNRKTHFCNYHFGILGTDTSGGTGSNGLLGIRTPPLRSFPVAGASDTSTDAPVGRTARAHANVQTDMFHNSA